MSVSEDLRQKANRITVLVLLMVTTALFWGAVMAVLAVLPGIGTALVWVPAVAFLFAGGHTASAVGLALWCAIVVGSADNVLRPMLVGKDTEMPDLLVMVLTAIVNLVVMAGVQRRFSSVLERMHTDRFELR